jgi:serine/threonine protein kinase
MDSLKPGDPRRIGDYVLSGRLGAGGMGEVFFGRSPSGRAVAVKLIYPLFADDPEFRRRFRLEVEACRRVGGFHTAPVVDADPDAYRPWMVTAYVEGPSLTQVLARCRALPLDSTRMLGAGLAEALVAIHTAGIVHRDLKPSNILLVNDGPRVIDFGIARAVDASAITARPGTPGFIAPEVLKGKPITPACDVFSLGVVLAFARGIRPYGEGPPEAIDYRVVHQEPDLQGLDPVIRDLVAKCLVQEPETRPTPAEILGWLADYGSVAQWLPEAVHLMITACAPPSREPPESDTSSMDESRLLAQAEQIARALPDEYERASALLHVATVVCRTDPAHAARLLDDARYPARNAPEAMSGSRRPLLEYLIESSPVEVGTVVGRIDPGPATQMVTDIMGYSQLLTLRHMGSEEETAKVIIALAEAVASANAERADRIAHILTEESLQFMAVARVAMVAAHTDPAQASQIVRTLTTRIEQVTRLVADRPEEGRTRHIWRRPKASRAGWSAEAPFDYDAAGYWAARAMTEVAIGMTGADPIRVGRLPTDAQHFARTITSVGNSHARTSSQAGMTGIDPARALADAERLAKSITASSFTAAGVATDDLRARALAAVKSATARIDPARADVLLAEAEQAARTISTDSGRFESLGQVALTAARTDPARAEQIARSLLRLPHKLGDLALAVAPSDPARAERIAASIADEYLRALIMAVLAVQSTPYNAEPLLIQAEEAAAGIPARMIEVAMVTARTDLGRAEQMARGIESGPEIIYLQSDDERFERSATTGYVRSAEYWRARALADLATVSYESSQ